MFGSAYSLLYLIIKCCACILFCMVCTEGAISLITNYNGTFCIPFAESESD